MNAIEAAIDASPQAAQPVGQWVNDVGDIFRLCPVVGNLQILIREYGRPDKWSDVKMSPAHALTKLRPNHADAGEVERPSQVAMSLQAKVKTLEKERDTLRAQLAKAEAALKFYADGDHLLLADPDAWDTCSGEPVNFLHDEAGTASIEDGSIAKAALSTTAKPESNHEPTL